MRKGEAMPDGQRRKIGAALRGRRQSRVSNRKRSEGVKRYWRHKWAREGRERS